MTIGFVTSMELNAITRDDELIVEALARHGVTVKAVCWDSGDPPADIGAFVLRSPWNYHLEPDAFLRWVDRAGESAPIFNAPKTVRWNAHKSYLFELAHGGIPVIETVLRRKHEPSDLHAIMAARHWSQVVVKPAISASSFMTSVVGESPATYGDVDLAERVVQDGQRALDRILETRDALVQPFMPEVIEHGERSLIFIDGQFSHAVQKAPFTSVGGGGRAVTAEPEQIEIGRRALSLLGEDMLYARVDLLRGADGVHRLMELELIDPELYVRCNPSCADRFAAACLRRFPPRSGACGCGEARAQS